MPQITLNRKQIEKLQAFCAKHDLKKWFLAKDQGAYVGASIGRDENCLFYFNGCDPDKNEDWYDEALCKFGGDDFGEHFDVELLDKAVANPLTTSMVVKVSQSSIAINTFALKEAPAAPKPSAPKPAPKKTTKTKKRNIGSVAFEAIREGKSNEEVLEAVKTEFPEAKTNLACINWYRNKLNKES